MAAPAAGEVEAAGAVPPAPPPTLAEEVAAARKALRREGPEEGEGTSCLAVAEAPRHLAWTEAAVAAQPRELLKGAGEEPLFPGQEGEEGPNCAEAAGEEAALPGTVVEVVVLAFVVHF